MYLDSKDYQTVWRLAHNWVGLEPEASHPDDLSPELQTAVHRLMRAAFNREITVRTRRLQVFSDDSTLSFLFDFRHMRNFLKCLRHDQFDPAYLDTLYLKRGDLLRWCDQEYLDAPPIWKIQAVARADSVSDESDEDQSWYDELSDRRKQRVTCLQIAKQLWAENPGLSYREVHAHPIMTKYGYKGTGTLSVFKKWARRYASDYAKQGGNKEKQEVE